MCKTDNIKQILRGLLEKENRMKLIMLAGALAIAMICLSDSVSSCGGERSDASQETTITAQSYARELEERLCDIISSIDGAGEVRVMVTLQNGVEYIYASEDKSSVDTSESIGSGGQHSSDAKENSENKYILIETEDGEGALICTELMPTVNGIVVVCSGANDPIVAANIETAVTTALNISAKRVCIIPIAR